LPHSGHQSPTIER